MKWGLTQGIIGRKLATFAPSARALGPNTYLGLNDFLKMLGIAFAVHAVFIIMASLLHHESVTNIPVRALSFKLGDQDQIAANGTSGVGMQMNNAPTAPAMHGGSWRSPNVPVPPAPRPTRSWQPTTHMQTASYAPAPVKSPKIVPIYDPAPVPVAQPVSPYVPAPQTYAPSAQVAAFAAPQAIAATPQQYVREVGAANSALAGLPTTYADGTGAANGMPGGQGTQSASTAQTEQIIRDRYEQQISGWIERHKIYPAAAGGRAGRVTVRMRIDRAGAVRYYAIEETSGSDVLDAAAIDMIRRANPVPAAPADYPQGSLIEFLIPISFRAPQ